MCLKKKRGRKKINKNEKRNKEWRNVTSKKIHHPVALLGGEHERALHFVSHFKPIFIPEGLRWPLKAK
jgi:hypothetical protein